MNIQQLFETHHQFLVTGLTTDHRQVKAGDLFVCIKGYTVDGHQFAKAAEEAGACAIVTMKHLDNLQIPQFIVPDTSLELPRLAHLFYHQPTNNLQLVGVTGTNGKTTTAYLLEHLLATPHQSVGYIGTNGIRYGNVFLEPKNTTPDALNLQRTLQDMVQSDIHSVALEVSSHALELHRVDYCEFDLAIFTNLTPEHLDFHPTMTHYFEAKRKLFNQLKPNGYGVVNLDDPYGRELTIHLMNRHQSVMTYGINQSADFQAKHIQMTAAGTQFELHSPEGVHTICVPLLGEFNVYNLLGALASAYASGLSMSHLLERLQTLKPVDGRMELIHEGQDFTVLVDYAHTPDGVEKVLEFVNEIKTQQVKVVIGCPGDRDRTKRPVIADLSVQYADDVIFTTDDPHSEEPEAILEEMTQHLSSESYQSIVDRTEAIQAAILTAQPNDIVVIAGRGHEKVQYWKGYTIPLDDREIAKQMIRHRLTQKKVNSKN